MLGRQASGALGLIHPSAWKGDSPKLISVGSPLRPQRPLLGLLMDTPPYFPDEFFGLLRRKEDREATGRKPTYEPPSSSPFCKALHARTAHFTRAGYFITPLRAARSSCSGNSSSPTIMDLKLATSLCTSSRFLPTSRSAIIEAEAWEMEQPCPVNFTSASLSPSKRA